MKAQGWQIFGTGPADHDPGAFEVLGKKAGSDGFYWEMGAVVSATTFGPDAPPAGQTALHRPAVPSSRPGLNPTRTRPATRTTAADAAR